MTPVTVPFVTGDHRGSPPLPAGPSSLGGRLDWWRQTAKVLRAAARGDESREFAVRHLSTGLRFDAALLTVSDPADPSHHRVVANSDYPAPVVQYMATDYVAACPGFAFARDAMVAARVCDTPFDFRKTRTFMEHLGPLGFNEGVTLVVETPWHGSTGMLAMSSTSRNPMDETTRLGLTLLGSDLAGLLAAPLPEVVDECRPDDLVLEVDPRGRLTWHQGEPGDCELPLETVLSLARHVRVSRRRRVSTFQKDAANQWWRLRAVSRGAGSAVGSVVLHMGRREPAGGLTGRELEVLTLVTHGMTNNEIADELHLSLRTVKAHLEALLLKLRQTSRAGLVRVAVEEDLQSPAHLHRAT